jgi:hypothetical protein
LHTYCNVRVIGLTFDKKSKILKAEEGIYNPLFRILQSFSKKNTNAKRVAVTKKQYTALSEAKIERR